MIRLLLCAAGLLALAALSAFAEPRSAPTPGKFWVFVGTYTDGKSKGIYRLEMDSATGKLSEAELAAETPSPSFLAIRPGNHFLYAVAEAGERGKPAGAVAAFALDPKSGQLTALNRDSSGGAGPCHLVVDHKGKHVLAANYGGGSVCVLPIGEDGKLGPATAFHQHKGSSVNKDRQEAPHAHSVNLDAANRFAFVADLGLDKVLVYRYDADKGTLEPNDPPAADLPPGAGPRHFAFHPDGKHAYAINELAQTITAFRYDPERGVLTSLQTVSTVPEPFKGNSTAEVVVHPSGRFLYGSNRGYNSIAGFAIDPRSGELTPAGQQRQDIKVPRNFNIDPTGRFLVVANQDSDSLVAFRIDARSGALLPTGQKVPVPKPVCVKFVPKAP
jgi:6-phosphogluconolactonase